MIFNKFLISNWGFHYPFFLTTWHCLLSVLLTQFLARTTNLLPSLAHNKVTWTIYFTTVMPVAFFFAAGVVLGNMAYQFLSVAYIQMIKAINPVPLLLLYFAFGKEQPSAVLLASVLIISGGVYISSLGELQFSWTGFAVQMGAVFSDCLRIVNMDGLLKDAQLDTMSLLYYTAPLATLFVGIGFAVMEQSSFPWEMLSGQLAWMLLANGFVAFSVNFSAVFVISCTSGMVMSVCGPFKDILVILSSSVIFGAPITSIQFLGFLVSITGMLLYRLAKLYPEYLNGLLKGIMTNTAGDEHSSEKQGDREMLIAK